MQIHGKQKHCSNKILSDFDLKCYSENHLSFALESPRTYVSSSDFFFFWPKEYGRICSVPFKATICMSFRVLILEGCDPVINAPLGFTQNTINRPDSLNCHICT